MVTPGDLLGTQPAPAFLQNDRPDDLDVALVVLGDGAGLEGTGELMRVTLSEFIALDAATIVARDVDNDPLSVQVSVTTAVPPDASTLVLAQNAPNPFNPATVIRFVLPAAGRARLAVLDLRGRLVAELLDDDLPAGEHAATWRGRDDSGADVASGVYLYRLETAAGRQTRRLTLLR